MSEITEDEQWFAMRATYGRNLMAQTALADEGLRTFIPMHYVRRGRSRRTVPQLVPVIRDLLFVRTTKDRITTLKKNLPYLHFIIRDSGTSREPVVVPERQMQQFIAVSSTDEEQLEWLSPETVNLSCGDAVRVVGGPFAGQEGVLVRVPGKRSKCVVVAIQGVIAVAMTKVHPSLIEIINE